MAKRYEEDSGEPDLELIDYLPKDNHTPNAVYAKVSTFLQWHNSDPADNGERTRKKIIYSDFQNNRNPFINYPEFAFNMVYAVNVDINRNMTLLDIYPTPLKKTFTINIESANKHKDLLSL